VKHEYEEAMFKERFMPDKQQLKIDLDRLTPGEREELTKLGLLGPHNAVLDCPYQNQKVSSRSSSISKHAISAPQVLNEACSYGSSFPRGLRLDFGGLSVLLISGTASIDENGKTIHVGDFSAQCWRTYRNITTLLSAEGATWHDVVRTTNYLRDIERDYEPFNRIRTSFYDWLGLDPLPASVGVQARLCRSELLVEIEAVAIVSRNDSKE
jgi:2-iminobutanoate/2-iminopropanoate deaminase